MFNWSFHYLSVEFLSKVYPTLTKFLLFSCIIELNISRNSEEGTPPYMNTFFFSQGVHTFDSYQYLAFPANYP